MTYLVLRKNIPAPAWHAEVLAEREKLVREGKTHFSDLAEVEQRLRKALP